jgi:hypothetical protein
MSASAAVKVKTAKPADVAYDPRKKQRTRAQQDVSTAAAAALAPVAVEYSATSKKITAKQNPPTDKSEKSSLAAARAILPPEHERREKEKSQRKRTAESTAADTAVKAAAVFPSPSAVSGSGSGALKRVPSKLHGKTYIDVTADSQPDEIPATPPAVLEQQARERDRKKEGGVVGAAVASRPSAAAPLSRPKSVVETKPFAAPAHAAHGAAVAPTKHPRRPNNFLELCARDNGDARMNAPPSLEGDKKEKAAGAAASAAGGGALVKKEYVPDRTLMKKYSHLGENLIATLKARKVEICSRSLKVGLMNELCQKMDNAIDRIKTETTIRIFRVKDNQSLSALVLSSSALYARFFEFSFFKDIARMRCVSKGMKTIFKMQEGFIFSTYLRKRFTEAYNSCFLFNQKRFAAVAAHPAEKMTNDYGFNDHDDAKRETKWKVAHELVLSEVIGTDSLEFAYAQMNNYMAVLAKRLISHDNAETDYVRKYGRVDTLPAPIMAYIAQNFRMRDISEAERNQYHVLSERAFFAFRFILKTGRYGFEAGEFYFNNVAIEMEPGRRKEREKLMRARGNDQPIPLYEKFTDYYLPYLLEALGSQECVGVNKLFLHNNDLTDESISVLKAFCEKKKIVMLRLYGNKFSAKGLAGLAKTVKIG